MYIFYKKRWRSYIKNCDKKSEYILLQTGRLPFELQKLKFQIRKQHQHLFFTWSLISRTIVRRISRININSYGENGYSSLLTDLNYPSIIKISYIRSPRNTDSRGLSEPSVIPVLRMKGAWRDASATTGWNIIHVIRCTTNCTCKIHS